MDAVRSWYRKDFQLDEVGKGELLHAPSLPGEKRGGGSLMSVGKKVASP